MEEEEREADSQHMETRNLHYTLAITPSGALWPEGLWYGFSEKTPVRWSLLVAGMEMQASLASAIMCPIVVGVHLYTGSMSSITAAKAPRTIACLAQMTFLSTGQCLPVGDTSLWFPLACHHLFASLYLLTCTYCSTELQSAKELISFLTLCMHLSPAPCPAVT